MGYDGYFEFGPEQLVNIARTAKLADALNINTVRVSLSAVAWVETATKKSGEDFSDITDAPWYDAGVPASTEFAGILPLSVSGLDDSTRESETEEYITDGGRSGKPRNATLPLVWNVAIIASTERGAKFGKAWLDRTLRGGMSVTSCSGTQLEYFAYGSSGAPLVHRRSVRTTRGTSVTRKRSNSCSVTWLVTFTMTADDPYEYSLPAPQVVDLGATTPTGAQVASHGTVDLVEQSCPVYDYSPLYDPDFPALVPSPTAPNFLPDGWGIEDGMNFRRKWVRLNPFEPTVDSIVPLVTLSTTTVARMVRVGIWPSDAANDEQCGALFLGIVSYLPDDIDMYLDGEQQVSYVWDGFSEAVRRADSLLYGTAGAPVGWTSFNDEDGLLITLDIFEVEGGGWQGDEDVRASVEFITKSE